MLLKVIKGIYIFIKQIPYITSLYSKSSIAKNAKIVPICKLNNVEVNEYTYIATNSSINFARIGKFCSIGPNLFCGFGIHPLYGLSTSPMFYSTERQNGFSLTKENKIIERKIINIGNDVFIGANVTILDGVSIGDGAVIGAGSVVNKDIPSYAIASGVPCNVIRYRFTEKQINDLLKIKWWTFDSEKLKSVEELFFDIDKFIDKWL